LHKTSQSVMASSRKPSNLESRYERDGVSRNGDVYNEYNERLVLDQQLKRS